MGSNWNIDETPYPGPVLEAITLSIDPANSEYSIEYIGDSSWFSGSVISLPNGGSGLSLINRWIEVRNDDVLIYEGYLNGIEYESMFFGGRTKINVTASSKLVQMDVNYG